VELASSQNKLQSSLAKLSSGKRVIDTSNDPAGASVSLKLSAAFNRFNAAQTNLMNAQSFKFMQDNALKELGDIVTRLGELKTLSLDPTKSTADISNYASEYSSLASAARGIAQKTFNGVRLFSDTISVK
jgi:flagellin